MHTATRSIVLALALGSASTAIAGPRKASADDTAGLDQSELAVQVMTIVLQPPDDGTMPRLRARNVELHTQEFSDLPDVPSVVVQESEGVHHLIWLGLVPSEFYARDDIELKSWGRLSGCVVFPAVQDRGPGIHLLGTCEARIAYDICSSEYELRSSFDETAVAANARALALFAAQQPDHPWAAFIAERQANTEQQVVQVAADLQAAQEQAEAEAAEAEAAVEARLARREEMLASLRYEDLPGLLGRGFASMQGPFGLKARIDWVGSLHTESAGRFDLIFTDQSAAAIRFDESIQGFPMGETEREIIDRLGPPAVRLDEPGGFELFWKNEGWGLKVTFSGDSAQGLAARSTHATVADLAYWRSMQQRVSPQEREALDRNILCSVLGERRDSPAVTALVQRTHSSPEGERWGYWTFEDDGLNLQWNDATRIESVIIWGPAGEKGTYTGPLPGGGSVHSGQTALVERYGASWDGASYEGSLGSCRVSMTFDSEYRLQKARFYGQRGPSGPGLNRDEWVQASNEIKFRCDDMIETLRAQMPAIDESGWEVSGVGRATAVDTPNSDGTTTRTYEQRGIEFGSAPDNSAALSERARLQTQIDKIEAACEQELEALGERPE